MRLRQRLRDYKTAAPKNGLQVKIYRLIDNFELATVTTDGNGEFTYQEDGNPGPYYYEAIDGDTTIRSTSRSQGGTGSSDLGEMIYFLGLFGSGVKFGTFNNLEVTTPQVGMKVQVRSGAALASGVGYVQYTDFKDTTIAASGVLPRIDLVGVRIWLDGHAEEGRSELVVVTGTPAASPVAPVYPVEANKVCIPLAEVRVDASVTFIATSKITDKRIAVAIPIPANSVGSLQIAADAVNATHIAADQIGASEIAPLAVGTAEIANNAVTIAKMAPDSVGSAQILADSVGASEIIAGAVGTAEIALAAVINDRIAVGTITEDRLSAALQVKVNDAGGALTIKGRTEAGVFEGYSASDSTTIDFREWFIATSGGVGKTNIQVDTAKIATENAKALVTAKASRDGTSTANVTDTAGAIPTGLSTTLTIPSDGRTYDVQVEGFLNFFNSTATYCGIEVRLGANLSGYVGGQSGSTYQSYNQDLVVLALGSGAYTVALWAKPNAGTMVCHGGWVRATAIAR